MPLPVNSYIGAAKDNLWIRGFMEEWKLDRVTGGGDFSISLRLKRYSEESPDSALALLVSLAEGATDEKERIAIAEPLEWLLEQHGVEYWDTLNELCSRFGL